MILGLILLYILISALRNPILFKMGLRNIVRRPGMSILVVTGLMIGTVIITTSMIIGDTMDNMITWEVYNGFYEVDEVMVGETEEGESVELNQSDLADFRAEVTEIPNVEHVEGLTSGMVSVHDIDSDMTTPGMMLLGVTEEQVDKFGGFLKDGNEYRFSLESGELIMDEDAAEDLEAEEGDHLSLYSNTHLFNFTLKDIVDKQRLGGLNQGGNIWVTAGQAQEMVFGFFVEEGKEVVSSVYYKQGFLESEITNGTFMDVNVMDSKIEGGTFISSTVESSSIDGGVFIGEEVTELGSWSFIGPDVTISDGFFNNVFIIDSQVRGGIFENVVLLDCDISGAVPDLDVIMQSMGGVDLDMDVLFRTMDPSSSPIFSNATFLECNVSGGFHIASPEMPNRYIDCSVGGGIFNGVVFERGDLSDGMFLLAEYNDTNVNPSFFESPYNVSYVLIPAGLPGSPFTSSGPEHPQEQEIVEDLSSASSWSARENADTNLVNMVIISNVGDYIEGEKHCDQVTTDIEVLLRDAKEEMRTYGNLRLDQVKSQELEDAKDEIRQFSDMFLVFGSFSIIAGLILIVNIFILLAEERKGEMGMARAVGMLRSQLRKTFMFEGAIYATLAAFVGVILGILAAYGIIFAMQRIFGGFGEDLDMIRYFHFESLSLILSFSAGFLLTIGTVIIATTRIAKLNSVRAIRSIPGPAIPASNLRLTMLGIFMIVIGILVTLSGVSNEDIIFAMGGSSVAFFGCAIIARRFISDRIAFTVMSLWMIFFWLSSTIGIEFFPFEEETDSMGLFVLSGLFLVSSGVLLVVFNSNVLIAFLSKLVGRGRATQAILKIGMSYPLRHRFRTALTIFMFALVIFTMVVMSSIIYLFTSNMGPYINSMAGDFDIIGFSGEDLGDVDDFAQVVEEHPNMTMADVERVYLVPQGDATVNYTYFDTMTGEDEVRNVSYPIVGVDDEFIDNTTYTFNTYLESEYDEEGDVWDGLLNESRVILDGTAIPEDFGPRFEGVFVEVGDTITLISADGSRYEKLVIWILDETFLNGVFMREELADTNFNVTARNVLLVDLDEDVDSIQWSKDLERSYTRFGLFTIPIESITEQIEQGMSQIFDLFIAFMGLGLIVGIAGLGIITIRSIHERRREIGMIRAIGFKKRMVSSAFLTEAMVITVIGIFIGNIMGIAIGVIIWQDGFKEMGFEFAVPWSRIVTISIITLVAAFLCTIAPARAASKVAPAEALRYD